MEEAPTNVVTNNTNDSSAKNESKTVENDEAKTKTTNNDETESKEATNANRNRIGTKNIITKKTPITPPLRRAKNTRKSDALEEYLHLTASAVKINFPSVDISALELIEKVRKLPFYRAHDTLTRYMMERLQWEQYEQQRILQIKAAAIAAQKEHELKRQNSGNFSKFFRKMFSGTSSNTINNNTSNISKDTTNSNDNSNVSTPNFRQHSIGSDHSINSFEESMSHGSIGNGISLREKMQLNMIHEIKPKPTQSGGTSLNLGSLEPPKHRLNRLHSNEFQSSKSRYYHSYRRNTSNNTHKNWTLYNKRDCKILD